MARGRLGPYRNFFLLVAFHVAASTAFAVAFRHAFAYRRLLIPLHAGLIASLAVFVTLLLGALISVRRVRTWRGTPYLVAAIPATLFAILLLLYVTDFVTNNAWGLNVTWGVIGAFLPELGNLSSVMPFSLAGFLLRFALVLALICGVYFALAKRLLRGLEAMFLPGGPYSLFGSRARAAISTLGIAIFVAGFVWFMTATIRSPRNFWAGEPLVGLWKAPPMFGNNARRIQTAVQDRRVRDAYPHNVAFTKRNVILVLVDSLRADHMGIYGYSRPTTPFLASLDAQGRLKKVKFSVSNCCDSSGGILSTLAARNYANLADYNFKLQDLLRDQGYKAYFLLTGDHTHLHGYWDMLVHSADLYFDGTHSSRYAMNDDRMLIEGLDQVPDFAGTPGFFYFHMMSVHFTGLREEAYNVYRPSDVSAGDLEDMWYFIRKDYDREAMTNRYDNGILQADALLKEIFAALDRKGYLRDALIVIAADHGEALGERGNYSHSKYLYQEDIHIPIVFVDEPQASYANLEFAAQIDIAPTLVDRLGLPVPDCWDGRSLLDPRIKEFSLHTTQRQPISRAVIYRTPDGARIYKYFCRYRPWHADDAPPEAEELYELLGDPGEARNLIAEADPAMMAMLREQMNHIAGHTP